MTETKYFRDAFRGQFHELSGQPNTYEKFFFSPCKFLIWNLHGEKKIFSYV